MVREVTMVNTTNCPEGVTRPVKAEAPLVATVTRVVSTTAVGDRAVTMSIGSLIRSRSLGAGVERAATTGEVSGSPSE